jgi:hypothetical protein
MKNQTPMELNKRLAELLGWQNIFDAGGTLIGRPPGGAENSRDQAAVPDWAGSWAAAGPLIAAHQIDVLHNVGSVHGSWGWGQFVRLAVSPDDGNRDAATRLALTRAVADKLEADQ